MQKRDLAVGIGITPLLERLRKTLERYGTGAGALRQAVPKLLGEKRHEGMEQAKRRIKNGEKISPRGDGHFAMRRVCRSVRNGRLDPFHVPVAEVAPEEVIDGMRRFVETVMRERIINDLDVMRQPRKNPAVGQRHLAGSRIRRRRAQFRRSDLFAGHAGSGLEFFQVDEHKSRGIPDFVGEGAITEDAIFAQNDIGARRGHAGEGEAHGIGAEFLVELDGIDAGALGLRHFLAFRRAHQRVQINLAERNAARELQAHDDHPRNPKKQNVVGGYEGAGRVIGAVIGGVVRPTERRKRPKRRAEPGFEHIGFLDQLRRPAVRASCGRQFAPR